MRNCRIAFDPGVEEAVRGANIGMFRLQDVQVEGAKKLFLNFGDLEPEFETEKLEGVKPAVEKTDAKFTCKSV